jgi:hypothetical protein
LEIAKSFLAILRFVSANLTSLRLATEVKYMVFTFVFSIDDSGVVIVSCAISKLSISEISSNCASEIFES